MAQIMEIYFLELRLELKSFSVMRIPTNWKLRFNPLAPNILFHSTALSLLLKLSFHHLFYLMSFLFSNFLFSFSPNTFLPLWQPNWVLRIKKRHQYKFTLSNSPRFLCLLKRFLHALPSESGVLFKPFYSGNWSQVYEPFQAPNKPILGNVM